MLHTVLLALTLAVGAQDTLLVQPLPAFNKQIVAFTTQAHLMVVVPGSPDTIHFRTENFTSLEPAPVREPEKCKGVEPGFLMDSVRIQIWVRDTVLLRTTTVVPRFFSPRQRILIPLRGKAQPVLEMVAVAVPESPCGDKDGIVFFTFGVHQKDLPPSRGLNSQIITGDELRRGGNQGLEGVLQGRFPGVRIRSVIGGIYFEIRGAPALCVINEMPVKTLGRGVCPVVPNDIETLEILRNPSEVSKYNLFSGEGGVVRITTRLHR